MHLGLILNNGCALSSIVFMTLIISEAFEASIYFVNASVLLPLLMVPPMSVVTSKLFNCMKLDAILRIAASLQMLGALLRMVAMFDHSFTWIFLGYLCFGLALSIALNCINVTANQWFPQN